MLKFDLFNPFGISCKCGPAIIASGIMGASSIVSGILGSESADSQMDAQIAEAEKNRQFNREEAQKNRDWQAEQADIARNWQSDEWTRQFGASNLEWRNRFYKENAQWFKQQQYQQQLAYNYWMKQQQFNTPAMQVQRGIEAGINPAASLGTAYGSTGLSAAPTSVASPSVSVPSTPSSPLPSGSPASVSNSPNIGVSKADAFQKMASGFSDIISAITKGSKDVADTKTANALRDSVVRAAVEDVTNKQLLNEWQQLENGFQAQAIPKRLEKLGNEARNLLASAMLAQTEEELKQCQIVSEQFRQNILDKEDKYKAQDLIIITATAANIDRAIKLKNDLLIQQANTEKSKQQENYAASFKLRAEGTTENQLRPLREKSLELSNDIARANRRGLNLDNWLKDETLRAKAKIVIEEARRANLITQEEVYRLGKQIDDYNHRDIDRFFNWLGQGAGAFRDFGVGSSSISTGVTKSTPVDSPWTIYGGSAPTSGSGSFISPW